MEDDEIRILLKRLARPNSSGGAVIERAAILAEGGDFEAVLAWITAHDGMPEAAIAATSRGGGLHGSRMTGGPTADDSRPPRRYVVPAEALLAPAAPAQPA